MSEAKTRKAFVLRDFLDAGNGRHFTAEEVVEVSAGQFANYEAAGLVRAQAAEDRKAEAKAAAPASNSAQSG